MLLDSSPLDFTYWCSPSDRPTDLQTPQSSLELRGRHQILICWEDLFQATLHAFYVPKRHNVNHLTQVGQYLLTPQTLCEAPHFFVFWPTLLRYSGSFSLSFTINKNMFFIQGAVPGDHQLCKKCVSSFILLFALRPDSESVVFFR